MKEILIKVSWLKEHTKGFVLVLTLPLILEVILSVSSVAMAIISKNLIDAAENKDKALLITYVGLFIGSIIIQLVLDGILLYIRTHNTELISNKLRENLLMRVNEKQWGKLSRYHSGDISTRMTSDIGNITSILVNTIPDIVSLAASLIASFFALLLLKPSLAMIAFILGPISLILSRLYARKLKKFNANIQNSESSCRSFLQEAIQNITIIKTFCLEQFINGEFKKLQDKKYRFVMGRGRMTIVSNSALSISYWVGYAIAFAWGAVGIFNGSETFGALTAFIQLINKVQGPFTGLAYSLPQLISSSTSIERIMELENLEKEIKLDEIADFTSVGIRFENVSFFYEENKYIVNDASLQIEEGETVALIGPSGKGKTTLIRLIMGLLKPNSGTIYVGDKEKEFQICASTRKLISYVPQGNTLFSGTIIENIRMGCEEASKDEVIEALRSACAWDFIKDLKNGIYTTIGERGIGLSEGQAQRIAIARAIIHKTPILLLDEATSALDAQTEIQVLNNIQNLDYKPTCIIITHRNTALKICDRVITLETEGIVEIGNLNYQASNEETG
ncbi:ABC transporter ATP-binding protein [Clostridium manihotivorum]|uniref:ABC transporter ATP-binding protein n=1 Tax=Clostridium manihotivorum TaxID=2320868 RepID=A0A410DZM8_9CLOT|nr:ABC transporter ATP-binding protein [Clostridium manihotivorum]QAA34508.1 ABC transporter ATP-binding protein [Clostridium manihotivorum]